MTTRPDLPHSKDVAEVMDAYLRPLFPEPENLGSEILDALHDAGFAVVMRDVHPGHGGPHIRDYEINTRRAYYYLGGDPVGPVTLNLRVDYDDAQCVDRYARKIANILSLAAWKTPKEQQ